MKERLLTFQITKEETEQLLSSRPQPKRRAASSSFPVCVKDYLYLHGFSHALMAHCKRTEEGICLNGVRVQVTHPITPGDVLTVRLTEDPEDTPSPPVPLPVSIVYEDEDILVVNKPAGMPVHASTGNHGNTLANAVSYLYRDRPEETFVYRCINRLDRDTTGLVLLAKNRYSAAILSSDMKQRCIHRTYLGIVRGILKEAGTVDAPIARVPGSVIQRMVDPVRGQRAVTHYSVVKADPIQDLSLLSFCLETGRTHQIRVHMQSIGHPLIGDFLYHPDQALISRQALHSWKLAFHHPLTGDLLSFTQAPPADMQDILPVD